MSRNGFTFIELLVSLIVAAIIVLTAGALSHIGLHSFNKESIKQTVYNDLSYGLKLIRNRFRNADSSAVHKNTSASNKWVGKTLLEIEDQAFGIYQNPKSPVREFVFLKDKSKEDEREVILSVPDGSLNWTINCDPSCSSPHAITVVLTGIKKDSPFQMETTIARRNP